MNELNLFEKFEGDDLDRLIECLKAIKEAGLTLDRTHTGVDIRIGRVCITVNRPDCVLVPLFKIWRI